MKKILFIVGSTRAKSFNLQVAKYVESIIKSKAEISFLEYMDVPVVNQDLEFPAPEAVTRVREAVGAADALWIFTPEYNCSYPGILKNVLDWLSRPLVAGDYNTPTVIRGKKVAVTGVGGGAKTSNCRQKLKELLEFIGADVKAESLGLRADMEAWVTDVLTLDNEQKAELAKQAENFLTII